MALRDGVFLKALRKESMRSCEGSRPTVGRRLRWIEVFHGGRCKIRYRFVSLLFLRVVSAASVMAIANPVYTYTDLSMSVGFNRDMD
jgi:hypothetical protein